MQRTVTDALLGKLKKACTDLCRKGLCTMECDAGGAEIGYCAAVWAAARGKDE